LKRAKKEESARRGDVDPIEQRAVYSARGGDISSANGKERGSAGQQALRGGLQRTEKVTREYPGSAARSWVEKMITLLNLELQGGRKERAKNRRLPKKELEMD